MKYILFLLLTFPMIVSGQLKENQKQDFPYKNLLSNSGFENGVTGWTKTAGTMVHTTTGAQVAEGGGALKFVPAASGNKIRGPLLSIPNGILSKLCIAKALVKSDAAGGYNYKLRVVDGSDVLIKEITFSQNTNFLDHQVEFNCPSSGSFRIEIESLGTGNELYIDSMFLGKDYRVDKNSISAYGGTDGNAKIYTGYLENNGSTCTITNAIGGAASSCARTGAGVLKITFNASYWTQTPTCICSSVHRVGIGDVNCGVPYNGTTHTISTTEVDFVTIYVSGGSEGSPFDTRVYFSCFGY